MNELQIKLEAWHKEYYADEKTKTYERDAMPEIYFLNLEYRQANPDQYGYNATIKDYILAKENISAELIDCLKTEIYLSQQQIQKEKEKKEADAMFADGWIKLTCDIIKQAFRDKKKIELNTIQEAEIFSHGVKEIFKPFVDNNGGCFLMKPKARSRGIKFFEGRFKSAFCKVI